MGTDAKVTFVETDGYYYKKELVSVRHHWDGYIDGVGHSLAEWLIGKKLINGIGPDQYSNEYANGVGCLAAWYIAENKNQPGDFYITPDGSIADYNYKIMIKDKVTDIDYKPISLNDITTIVVTCGCSEKPIFIGSPEELLKFQEPEEDDEGDE